MKFFKITLILFSMISIAYAGEYTDNYKLYMPDEGETGYADLLNENFKIIDNKIADSKEIRIVFELEQSLLQFLERVFVVVSIILCLRWFLFAMIKKGK